MTEQSRGRDTATVALESIQREIADIRRTIKGDEFSEQPGVLQRLGTLERDLKDIKTDRQNEISERRGMKRLLGWVGATSVTGVISTIALIITLIITLTGGGA